MSEISKAARVRRSAVSLGLSGPYDRLREAHRLAFDRVSEAPALSPGDAAWDVVIVGTGMGGAPLGQSLKRQGLKVLFLEQGLETLVKSTTAAGMPEDPDGRLRRGHWPERVGQVIDGRRTDAYVAAGCGVGGSTQIYAAALERFEPRDFDDTPAMPHPTGGWPVSYSAMAAFYSEAERLLRVRGTRDPLGESVSSELPRPPAQSAVDGVFMRDFADAGLHPYRLHVGIAYKPGCIECLGFACALKCKSDAKWLCVDPAVAGGAELRAECEVVKIDADEDRATGVIYRHGGRLHRVEARAVVIAAGTYRSAALLLGSANQAHPQGLANGSGLVGRNLMFHTANWIAVWPSRQASAQGPRKTIGLRDFYDLDGKRLGSFQSTGLSADYGNILMFLYQWFDRSQLRRLRFLRPFLRIPAKLAAKVYGNATIFALIVEDLPYPENRIAIDPEDESKIIVHYRISDELKQRTIDGRAAITRALRRHHKMWLWNDVRIDHGHPSGTCRFGHNPKTSVLDASCRTHDLDNLYVVDGSFMPTSAGANPSLTIAANALRVGEILGARLRAESVIRDAALPELVA